jgi:hypothetical protein
MTKSSTTKVVAKKARSKSDAAKKARDARRKTATKVAAEQARDTYRKTSPKAAIGEARDIQRKMAAQFEEFRDAQVPDSLRALAERNVAQTRKQYERSKNTLNAVLESWQKSFGAAGQGAVALNRKIIDIADRNIDNAFDLAAGLAGARNLTDVMELQAAYWRKQVGDLQAKEVRSYQLTWLLT